MTHPIRKRRYRQISLNYAAAVRASKKLQLSLIGRRPCAFHRAIDEPRALPLTSPNRGSKLEFLHLALHFISSLQVNVDTWYVG